MVVCPDGEYPYCTTGDLLDCLDTLDKVFASQGEVVYFIFQGQQAFVSKGPDRYLLWPDGVHRTPLFRVPVEDDVELEPDTSGRAGTADKDILPQSIERDSDENTEEIVQPSVMDDHEWQDDGGEVPFGALD